MANLGHYDPHSGYPCQSIFIAKKLKTTQAGNVSTTEAEAWRGSEWFEGGELDPDDRGVNAAGICFEMLCNDVTWMGAPESFLHQASFENIRDLIADLPLSPLITDQQDAQALLARLFEYHDLYGRPHRDTWQFELGIWPHGNIDVDALPEIDSNDLTEEPDLTGELWEDTINYVRARFSDRAHAFKEKLSDPASDPNNFRIVGEKRSVELDRTWCTDNDLANLIASTYLGINAQPKIKGSIKVKRESVDAKGLYPGELAKLNVASDGRTYVIQLGDMDWPAGSKGDVTFTVENARGIWPQRYVPPAVPMPGNFVVEPVEIVNERIVLLPSQLRTINSLQIAVLAQRPSDKIVGFAVHAGLDPDILDLVAPHNNFAIYGKLRDADYSAAGPELDTATGIIVEILGVDPLPSQTDAQRDDDNLLIFFGNEIASSGIATPIGGHKYQVTLRRARYGSLQVDHAIGEDVWFMFRDRITPIANKNFQPGATVYFKLQPYTQTQEYDLALVDAIAHVIGDGPFILAGLELAGQGNDHVFTGRNPKFAWRMFSIAGAEISGPELSLGAWDDQFSQFNLRVRDATSGAVVWTGSSKVPEYVFDYEQNALAAGGPRRTFHFEVAALARDGRQTPWLNVGEPFSNPAPAIPGGHIDGIAHNGFMANFDGPFELDHKGMLIWRSLDSAFAIGDAGVELIYDGPDTRIFIPQPEASQFYYRSAPYDDFTKDPANLNVTDPPLPISTGVLNPTLPPPPLSEGSRAFDTPFAVVAVPFAGDEIRYSLNGDVTLSSPNFPSPFTGGLLISQTCVLRWRGYYGPDKVPTQQGIAVFTLVAPAGFGGGGPGDPTCASVGLEVRGGRPHWAAITVALSCATAGATIQFNKNGAGWTAYTTAITLNLDDAMEFFASAGHYADSPTDYYENTDYTV